MKLAAGLATLLVLTAMLASPAVAAGDVERGKTLSYTCLGCHGIEGYRNAYPSFRVPKLGGQKAAYLELALKGYRQGERSHPTMQAQAVSLSDQDIVDISAYLATLANDTVEAGGTQNVESPQTAATCVACHGVNGIAVAPEWPTLAGQHEEYLVHALTQYVNGERKQAVMSQMAVGLTDADIRELAEFYAELDGLETTLPE